MRKVVRTSDVVVIGAGVIGCAVAFELARRGATVLVLDNRSIAAGATQASGGMLAPYSEAADGGPMFALGSRSLDLFDQFVGAVEAESGLRVGYARSGTLHVARTGATLEWFDELHARLTAVGVAAERLSAADTTSSQHELTGDVRGGLLIHGQGLVSAHALTRALAEAARRRGATFVEGVHVRRISSAAGGTAVDADAGSGDELQAKALVLAGGAWSGSTVIDGASPVPVKPIRGQLVHLGWTGAPICRITWDERCYVVPWPDGTVLVGATVEDVGFDERTTAGGVRGLLDAVCELFPVASSAHLLSVRAGLRPSTPDGVPWIGWSVAVPRLMYATGHYRNGVLLAPLTAHLVADAVLEDARDAALEVTSPARFGRL